MVELDIKAERVDAFFQLPAKKPQANYRFSNVQLTLPCNGDITAWNRFYNEISQLDNNNGSTEQLRWSHRNSIQLRLFLKGKMQDIDLDRVYTEKCLECIVPGYNPGIVKHLCSDPISCPAVFPDVTDHVKMGYKPGERVIKTYPQLKDSGYA